jgi:hypothetical protein
MQLPETLDGWLGLLEARHGQAIQLGLDRVRAVRDALDLPQTCPVFTSAAPTARARPARCSKPCCWRLATALGCTRRRICCVQRARPH